MAQTSTYSYTEKHSASARASVAVTACSKSLHLLQMQRTHTPRSCRPIPRAEAQHRRLVAGIRNASVPIVSHNGFVEMKFVEANLAKPCRSTCANARPRLTFASAVAAKVQLIILRPRVLHVAVKVVKEVKEQEVYMGEVP